MYWTCSVLAARSKLSVDNTSYCVHKWSIAHDSGDSFKKYDLSALALQGIKIHALFSDDNIVSDYLAAGVTLETTDCNKRQAEETGSLLPWISHDIMLLHIPCMARSLQLCMKPTELKRKI